MAKLDKVTEDKVTLTLSRRELLALLLRHEPSVLSDWELRELYGELSRPFADPFPPPVSGRRFSARCSVCQQGAEEVCHHEIIVL